MSTAWLTVALVPAGVCVAVIALLRRSALAQWAADHPNERSLHEVPTPRLGGVGLLAGALPVAYVFSDERLAAILACAVALAVLSAWDDLHSLPVQVRLPGHIAAAAFALLAAAHPGPGITPLGHAGALVAFVGLVWMANLYNFMDGSDGLAGGMAAIGFGALAIAAAQANALPLAYACAALASASLGFLAFNFPPARVFLGDAGSIPLGFLAGALGGYGFVAGAWPWWLPVLVFSPFIVDATVTLFKRLARGEKIWLAHRGHYYQRLVLSGWSARRLALSAYALMLFVSAVALLARGAGEMLQCGILVACSVAYLGLGLAIEFPRSTTQQESKGTTRAR